MQPPRALRILIVSTPKTGNVWLRWLLATLYKLPIVEVGPTFDRDRVEALGSRWVSHEHFLPEVALCDWAFHSDVHLITAVRHPGDVLQSLYHHAHNFLRENDDRARDGLLRHDREGIGEHTARYVAERFHRQLNVSLSWLATGRVHRVAYEALRCDPLAALTELTNGIAPVSQEAIRRAIESCRLSTFQALYVHASLRNHFREGALYGWQQHLPAPICALLAERTPYRQQCAALGYEWRRMPTPSQHTADSSINPFVEHTHFDNNVPVPGVIVRMYLEIPTYFAQQRWPEPTATDADSFYAWVQTPHPADPQGDGPLFISRLAAYLHKLDGSRFEDIFAADRVAYLHWFTDEAPRLYHLPPAFLAMANRGLDAWRGRGLRWLWRAVKQALKTQRRKLAACSPRETPGSSPGSGPPIPTVALALRAPFPDDGAASFSAWLNEPAPADLTRPGVPRLTRLAWYLHGLGVAPYTDVSGVERVMYMLWFISDAAETYQLSDFYLQPIDAALACYAADAADGPQDVLPLTPLAMAIYCARADLQARFADVHHRQRAVYLLWLLTHGAREYRIPARLLVSIRKALLRAAPCEVPTTATPPTPTGLTAALLTGWRDEATWPALVGDVNADFLLWFVFMSDAPEALRTGAARALSPWLNEVIESQAHAHMPWCRLAQILYGLRPDLRDQFPEPRGKDRPQFTFWLISAAWRDFALHPDMLRSVCAGLLKPVRPVDDAVPPLPYVAQLLYDLHPELCDSFPDIQSRHRLQYMVWFTRHASDVYGVAAPVISQVEAALAVWANVRVDTPAKANELPLTRIALAARSLRPDTVAAYPNLDGKHRADYLLWLVHRGQQELQLAPALLTTIQHALAQAAEEPDPDDCVAHADTPPLNRLVRMVYLGRPTLQAWFPDVYGRHRLPYMTWLIYYSDFPAFVTDGVMAAIAASVTCRLQQAKVLAS